MPILPPSTASVLDSVYSAIAAATVRLDGKLESLQAIGGQLLGNGTFYSQQVVNNSWRKMCEYLASIGFTVLKQETILSQLPVVAVTDPAMPTWVDWFNCNDGANLYAAPVLPPDLILPLKIWERPTGQNAVFPRDPMELMFDGLRGWKKQSWNGQWEWRANRIYMPGALQSMDLRILYMRYLGDFLDVGGVQWFNQLVPINRCQDALSLYICAEVRHNSESVEWIEMAESAARLLCNREVSMKLRGNIRRQSRSGRLESRWGYGW